MADIREVAERTFGLDVVECRLLAGEVDRNAFVSTHDGSRYVLKLHSVDADRRVLEMQDAALAHVAAVDPLVRVPKVVRSETIDLGSERRVARLLTWLDGQPLSDIDATVAHRRALGRAVATTDLALRDFYHLAAGRRYQWDLLHCDQLSPTNSWAASTLQSFCYDVVPTLRQLPQQMIHNDANDDNVVVDDHGNVALIDYGDIVTGPRVIGLGVAMTYAMLGRIDPLAAAVDVVVGYHQVAPLAPAELHVLDAVVRSRLAMSVAISEQQVDAEPGNADYLTTSQASISRLVELLDEVPPGLARATYRDACGYLPVAAQRDIETFLGSTDVDPAPIVDVDLCDAEIVDWTIDADRSSSFDDDRPKLGRYGEIRSIYDTAAFATPFGERRTLHLGVDVFVPSGTRARSPLTGVIHSCAIRDRPGDYGGVVIIEYATTHGTPFWMLVGHLGHAGVESLAPGDPVEQGAEFATVGTREENGGWAPHLHVQIFTDLLGLSTELDGVARASQRDVWTSISPNPAVLVGVERARVEASHVRTTESIARRRASNLSPSLSTSYDEPLHIVGGDGAELIDTDGRRFLDLVNNVAHVGHEHPRVVEAITSQVARLNTNTRYLHANIVDYAERLRALFPDPLSVVFFTNSGSEAVDLALRLARTATGRTATLTLDWAYHGNLSSLVEISPYKFNRAGGSGPTDRIRICDLPDPYRGEFGDDGAAYATDVGRHADDLADHGVPAAAFIHESISGCGGQIDLAPGYLQAAYEHARAAGALCIVDEVQCGLGRVGNDWWAFEAHDVVPDIVTMGKPLGNGHPLGAVVTTPHIARMFANGMEYFNTFGGNPVSCAAGLAVLDVIEAERLRSRAARAGIHLLGRLESLARRHQAIGDVRGRGLFVGVDLVEDRSTKSPATDLADRVVNALRRRGVLVSSDGPSANVLKIKPPMVVTHAQLDRFVDALDDVLDELGPAPGRTT